jgi:molybdopterin converting factor small subunit
MSNPAAVTVEFYGIPRERAGCAELTVQASTLAELIDAVQAACPHLHLRQGEQLVPHYRLSLDGRRFLTQTTDRLQPGERVLILSSDAGG